MKLTLFELFGSSKSSSYWRLQVVPELPLPVEKLCSSVGVHPEKVKPCVEEKPHVPLVIEDCRREKNSFHL
jgi:Tat protein secretion system quality control protein TatD with DNase activity